MATKKKASSSSTTTKKTHGGARKGAGRRSKPPEDKQVAKSIKAYPYQWEKLEAYIKKKGLSRSAALQKWIDSLKI